MQHDHIQISLIFASAPPLSPSRGSDLGLRTKILFDMFHIYCSSACMQKFGKQEMCLNVTNARKDEGISRTEARGQGHSDSKKVCDTLQPQDVFTHYIWDSYLKLYRRYAPDMIFLELRSEVKVTVTRK